MKVRFTDIVLPYHARLKSSFKPKDPKVGAKTYRQLIKLSAVSSMIFLTACTVGPKYVVPEMAFPSQYKYALSEQEQTGNWQKAQPAEAALRGEWWRLFNDDRLNSLQDAAYQANPSLQAALARLKKARALHERVRSGFFPQIGTGFGLSRERPSPVSEGLPHGASTPYTTTWRAEIGLSYEVDLFGRVASAADAAEADIQRNEALYQSVLLALQADIAQNFFLLQELDTERAVYARAMALRSESYRLVLDRHNAGGASELDISRAQTELESTRSDTLAIDRRRAVAENALAVLTGQLPVDFSAPFSMMENASIYIPPGLPSTLLERRPDIAAAERAMAAANARIGVAKSAFFPRLDLTAAGGFESAELGQLFDWSSRTFLLGPLIGGALSLPLFDGGTRRAQVDYSFAQYEEEVATYRQTVLNAFREVEDGLAGVRFLKNQIVAQEAARTAAKRSTELAQLQYRKGDISQLDAIDAERSFLDHQLTATRLRGEQARTVVQLVRALGGGWTADEKEVEVTHPSKG